MKPHFETPHRGSDRVTVSAWVLQGCATCSCSTAIGSSRRCSTPDREGALGQCAQILDTFFQRSQRQAFQFVQGSTRRGT
jgi:hypothetical protein